MISSSKTVGYRQSLRLSIAPLKLTQISTMVESPQLEHRKQQEAPTGHTISDRKWVPTCQTHNLNSVRPRMTKFLIVSCFISTFALYLFCFFVSAIRVSCFNALRQFKADQTTQLTKHNKPTVSSVLGPGIKKMDSTTQNTVPDDQN